MAKYANQKTIIIRAPKVENNFIQVSREDLEAASKDLTASELIIWLDLCGNKDGYKRDYSPAYYTEHYGLSESTCVRARKKFEELGYITSEGDKFFFNRKAVNLTVFVNLTENEEINLTEKTVKKNPDSFNLTENPVKMNTVIDNRQIDKIDNAQLAKASVALNQNQQEEKELTQEERDEGNARLFTMKQNGVDIQYVIGFMKEMKEEGKSERACMRWLMAQGTRAAH